MLATPYSISPHRGLRLLATELLLHYCSHMQQGQLTITLLLLLLMLEYNPQGQKYLLVKVHAKQRCISDAFVKGVS